MKKYLFLLSLGLLILLFSNDVKAEERIIDIPISANGYLKERWSIGYVKRKGFLAIGSDNSVYKQGRMRIYLYYSLSELGVLSEEIKEARLNITYYRADRNAPSSKQVLINPINHLPEKIVGTWPPIPEITENTIEAVLSKGSGVKEIDITKIIRNQLENHEYDGGIYITAQYEQHPEYFFYSNECSFSNLYYGPQCEQGMEPKIVLTLNDPPPTEAILEKSFIFSNNLYPISLKWDSDRNDEQFVEIGHDINFTDNSVISELTTDGTYQFTPDQYSSYFWRIRSERGDHPPLFSDIGKIVIFNTKLFIPKIELIDGMLHVTNTPEELNLQRTWEVSNKVMFRDSVKYIKQDLSLSSLCTNHGSILHIKAFITDPHDEDSKSSAIYTHHCNDNVPSSIKEKIAYKLPVEVNRNSASIKGESISNEKSESVEEPLSPIKCVSQFQFSTLGRKITCSKFHYELVSIENFKIDENQYWIKYILHLPSETIYQKEKSICMFTPKPCKHKEASNIEPHFIFEFFVDATDIKPYFVEQGEKGLFTFYFNQGEDYSGSMLVTEVELFIKGESEQSQSIKFYEKIPPATKPDYLKKEFIFPFSFPVGVTQWHGFTAFSSPHTGIDFGVHSEEIRALGDGEVIRSEYDTYNGICLSGGYYMVLKHPTGKHTVYMHLKKDSQTKKVGDYVTEGEVIAESGNSGAFNCQPLGYHLHLETRNKSSQSSHVDPVSLIEYNWNLVGTLNYQNIPGRLSGDNPHPGR